MNLFDLAHSSRGCPAARAARFAAQPKSVLSSKEKNVTSNYIGFDRRWRVVGHYFFAFAGDGDDASSYDAPQYDEQQNGAPPQDAPPQDAPSHDEAPHDERWHDARQNVSVRHRGEREMAKWPSPFRKLCLALSRSNKARLFRGRLTKRIIKPANAREHA